MFKHRSNKNRGSAPIGAKPLGIYCSNCGKNNHILSACTEPFTSYGLLCFYRANERSEYQLLMICRKHSIPYMDFLRGKFEVGALKYIFELFTKMTQDEVVKVIDWCDFSRLRYDLGLNDNIGRQFKTEYETSELKFNYLVKLGYLHRIVICYNRVFGTDYSLKRDADVVFPAMEDILNEPDVKGILSEYGEEETDGSMRSLVYEMPEWGLPKGKREQRETDLQCALREFCEETGIESHHLNIYKNVVPLEEVYMGMNNVQYKHVYFIGELTLTQDAAASLIKGQAGKDYEVGHIQLLSQTDALQRIRPYHTNKKSVVQKAFYIMTQLKTFFYG